MKYTITPWLNNTLNLHVVQQVVLLYNRKSAILSPKNKSYCYITSYNNGLMTASCTIKTKNCITSL